MLTVYHIHCLIGRATIQHGFKTLVLQSKEVRQVCTRFTLSSSYNKIKVLYFIQGTILVSIHFPNAKLLKLHMLAQKHSENWHKNAELQQCKQIIKFTWWSLNHHKFTLTSFLYCVLLILVQLFSSLRFPDIPNMITLETLIVPC